MPTKKRKTLWEKLHFEVPNPLTHTVVKRLGKERIEIEHDSEPLVVINYDIDTLAWIIENDPNKTPHKTFLSCIEALRPVLVEQLGIELDTQPEEITACAIVDGIECGMNGRVEITDTDRAGEKLIEEAFQARIYSRGMCINEAHIYWNTFKAAYLEGWYNYFVGDAITDKVNVYAIRAYCLNGRFGFKPFAKNCECKVCRSYSYLEVMKGRYKIAAIERNEKTGIFTAFVPQLLLGEFLEFNEAFATVKEYLAQFDIEVGEVKERGYLDHQPDTRGYRPDWSSYHKCIECGNEDVIYATRDRESKELMFYCLEHGEYYEDRIFLHYKIDRDIESTENEIPVY
jgi:hypothetical protein